MTVTQARANLVREAQELREHPVIAGFAEGWDEQPTEAQEEFEAVLERLMKTGDAVAAGEDFEEWVDEYCAGDWTASQTIEAFVGSIDYARQKLAAIERRELKRRIVRKATPQPAMS